MFEKGSDFSELKKVVMHYIVYSFNICIVSSHIK